MVATIDPYSGRVATVSLPRDTAQVPVGDGRTWDPKVNALFQHYLDQEGDELAAALRMKESLAYTFDTEIDHVALIGFQGFMRAINAIGGVDLVLEEALDDPGFENPDGTRGVRLDAGPQHLDGPLALAFARTRHQDTDYHRSRRQQQLVTAVIQQLGETGLAAAPRLMRVVENHVDTDIPLASAPAALELLSLGDYDGRKSVVLGPRRWASSPVRFTNVLRIDVVRAFFDANFGPVP
jgi:LCP family protein required for cell wall assembly